MRKDTSQFSSLSEARDAFTQALKLHEHYVYHVGYEDGFNAGWEAAISHLSDSKPDSLHFNDKSELSQKDFQADNDFLEDSDSESEADQGQETDFSARDAIVALIEQQPGLTRQTIIQRSLATVPNMTERRVRMALQRLKTSGDLRCQDNRWYVIEKRRAV